MKTWVKILVPVLIVLLVSAVFLLKQAKKDDPSLPADTQGETAGDEFSLRETEAIDYDELFSYGLPVFIDYGADACAACKPMASALRKVNLRVAGKAFVKFLDVWVNPDAVGDLSISLVPTQVMFTGDGKPFVPGDELAQDIEFDLITNDEGEHVCTYHQGALNEEEMLRILAEMGVVLDD